MHKRLSFVGAAMVAAFLIYCGDSAMKKGPDGGVLADAGAAACCGTAQTFTNIAAGTLRVGLPTSNPISAAGYSEIILYSQKLTNVSTSCELNIQWRPDPDTGFGTTSQVNLVHGGRVPVDGSDFQLVGGPNCSTTYSIDWTVAGIK